MSAPFALKDYQVQTLDALRDYFVTADQMDSPDTAFYHITRNPYLAPPALGPIPYICLRVPTGGGKTLLAAHAVNIAAMYWMKTDKPTVIWFVPSQTIRDQTLAGLRDRNNPNRLALSDRFGENVRIMDINEALYAKRADYDGGAMVIVATIQAFRVDNKEGRKVYESNGELMDHFLDVPPQLRSELEHGDGGDIICSLANVFRLRRPLIIADEAHNMRTDLSFDTLGRLSPSAIVEFTATPTTHAEHKPEKGKFASNILHHVSAAELRAADMIKLPVILRGRADPRETLADAIAGLQVLNDTAIKEVSATGEFIRPVMLLQAEARSKEKDTLHAEKLKAMLIDDFHIPSQEIALATGESREIDDVNLFDPECKINFIITQQALKEGWDCSFAYILCSVAEQKSERSVEQLLGRILRLPRAKRKQQEDLNRAYAYATTTSFRETAETLRDSLVANGFDKIEAETLVYQATGSSGMEEGGAAYQHEELIPPTLDATSIKEKIETLTRGRISFDLDNQKIIARGAITEYERKHIELAWPQGEAVIQRLAYKSRGVRLGPPDDAKDPIEISIPSLVVRRGNITLPFDKSVYIDEPWYLEKYDATKILDMFTAVSEGDEAKIDLETSGRIEIKYERMANIPGLLSEKGWTKAALINWLDRRLPRDERRDITSVSSKLFIDKALDAIAASYKYEFDRLVRAKFHILDALVKVIGHHRKERETEAWQSALFGPNALEIETSSDELFLFNSKREHDYSYSRLYTGPKFEKHLFRIVGDLEAHGEEYDCAQYLDHSADVEVWLRNTERKKNSFWMQTSSDKFYPDFVARLKDGRVLVVEYKGAHLAETADTKDKLTLGQTWASKSEGKCLFVMCVDKQFGTIQREIQKHS